MGTDEKHVVTGAFGYSGKYIAQHLLAKGHNVATLTNSQRDSDPFAGQVKVHPLSFNDPTALEAALAGTRVLYNTYWVRFNYKGQFTHSEAVENTLRLFEAASKAGVEKVVHTSITNPSLDSTLEYFRGKALLEKALQESGLRYAILRPAVLFGKEDILINNIAWFLRKFPVFGIFGDGTYRLQPIHVDDFAELACREGESPTNTIVDAIGPETFTYRELIKKIGNIIGHPRPIVSISPMLGLALGKAIGAITKDIVITKDEIEGLMADLLAVDTKPAGKTRLTEWAMANREMLGAHYASELGRRSGPRL